MEFNYNSELGCFVDAFTYGIATFGQSRIDLISEAIETPIVTQPTLSESEIFEWRNKIRSTAQNNNDPDSDKKIRELVKSLETTRFNKVIHLMKSNSIQNRFIDFWSNHLCISDAGSKLVMLPFLAQYEAEVIGKNIFSKYEDMLYASAISGGMLSYLNNIQNVDPDSQAGKRFGLNENYARELLELHTVSVSSNYTQEDVTNIAYLLTGWTVNFRSADPKVLFSNKRSTNKKINFFGKVFEAGNSDSLKNLIIFLARHPKTAEHVTEKMFKFFISEKIDKVFHKKLIQTWINTNGDLREISYQLMSYDKLLSYKKTKFRSPQEWSFLIAVLFSKILKNDPDYIQHDNTDFKSASPLQKVSLLTNKAMKDMGQVIWAAPSPKGWDISDEGWLSADSISMKLDYSYQLSENKLVGRIGTDFIDEFFPDLSNKTKSIISSSDSDLHLSLLLISPDLLRR